MRVDAAGTSYIWAPLVAFAAVGVLVLVLRWANRPGGSLLPKPPRRGPPDEYGTLVAVATPATEAEAARLVGRLAGAGIRATSARTTSGFRVYAWPRDESRATDVLRSD